MGFFFTILLKHRFLRKLYRSADKYQSLVIQPHTPLVLYTHEGVGQFHSLIHTHLQNSIHMIQGLTEKKEHQNQFPKEQTLLFSLQK